MICRLKVEDHSVNIVVVMETNSAINTNKVFTVKCHKHICYIEYNLYCDL